MALHRLFPSLVYTDRLAPDSARWNREILSDIEALRRGDEEGRRWSEENYLAGYTSYGSLAELHQISSTFAKLEKTLDRHVARYAKQLQWDLEGRKLRMSSCWVNVMGYGCAHSLHLHPLSVVSGTYYVQTPPQSGDFKVEDPRLSKFMASPTRPDPFIRFAPKAGSLILFESWLRHEVEPNRSRRNRISVSFNYDWHE